MCDGQSGRSTVIGSCTNRPCVYCLVSGTLKFSIVIIPIILNSILTILGWCTNRPCICIWRCPSLERWFLRFSSRLWFLPAVWASLRSSVAKSPYPEREIVDTYWNQIILREGRRKYHQRLGIFIINYTKIVKNALTLYIFTTYLPTCLHNNMLPYWGHCPASPPWKPSKVEQLVLD